MYRAKWDVVCFPLPMHANKQLDSTLLQAHQKIPDSEANLMSWEKHSFQIVSWWPKESQRRPRQVYKWTKTTAGHTCFIWVRLLAASMSSHMISDMAELCFGENVFGAKAGSKVNSASPHPFHWLHPGKVCLNFDVENLAIEASLQQTNAWPSRK